MDNSQANSSLPVNRIFSSLLLLSLICCSAWGQRFSTAGGLTYSVKLYTLGTVQVAGPEGLVGAWPRVMRGDMILAINEVPALSPEMLSDEHFCYGPRALLIFRPSSNQYFETVVRQPGCLFRLGRITFVPMIRPLVTVDQVVPSSPAARLGVLSGDILYRVGLYSVFGSPQMISARLGYGLARGPLYIYAVRNGQMIQLTGSMPVAPPAPPLVQAQQASRVVQQPATVPVSNAEAQPSQPEVQTSALRHTTLLLVNETPFLLSAAVHIRIDAEHERTDAWYTLLPGEKKQLSYTFPNQPQFEVFGESRSPDNVRWVHAKANSEATLYFEGADDDQAHSHVISRAEVSYTRASQTPLSDQTPVTEAVPFAPASVSESGDSFFLFQDAYLPYLQDTSGLTEDVALVTILSRARELGRAIERQRTFRSRFPSDKDVPYLLGVGTKDRNGRTELGVVVTSVRPATIFGDLSPFKVGDIITALSAKGGELIPVYSSEDIGEALYEHATDFMKGGISVPVKFELIRGSNLVTGTTVFHFNLECSRCFPAGELSAFRAILQGALNAWTLGNEAWLEAILTEAYRYITGQPVNDLTLDHWMLIQRNARLIERFPKETKFGETLAFYSFIPSAPRIIVGRLLARTVLMEGSAAFLTNIALDTAENATWIVLTASPTHSADDIREDVVNAAPQAAAMSLGMNVVLGAWNHHHRYMNLSKGQLK